jgi:hypothetical protein
VSESQAPRQNAKGHPCPPWCTRDHEEGGILLQAHRGDLARIKVPGADCVPDLITAGPAHLGMAGEGAEVSVSAIRHGSDVHPSLWLAPRDAGQLAALVDMLAAATAGQHRELAAAIRKAAADITDSAEGDR